MRTLVDWVVSISKCSPIQHCDPNQRVECHPEPECDRVVCSSIRLAMTVEGPHVYIASQTKEHDATDEPCKSANAESPLLFGSVHFIRMTQMPDGSNVVVRGRAAKARLGWRADIGSDTKSTMALTQSVL